jgi:hypothetical protein
MVLGLDRLVVLFVIWAFQFRVILIIHFALRKWRFEIAMRYDPFVYALGIPAAGLSILHREKEKKYLDQHSYKFVKEEQILPPHICSRAGGFFMIKST